jgi:murein L,D-transpeptidase YcbB/YkuD
MAKVLRRRSIGEWSTGLVLSVVVLGASASILGAQRQTSALGFAAAIDTVARSMPNDDTALRRVYGLAGYRPLWMAGDRPSAQALAVVGFIDSVAQRGLRAADYDVDALHAMLAMFPPSDSTLASDTMRVAAIDVALSRAVIHLLDDLERGRVEPGTLGIEMPARDQRDTPTMVVRVSQSDDVARTLETVEPRYAGYAALVRTLARYRALATDSSLVLPPDKRTVRPNDIYSDAPRLRRLLTALGDLSPDAAYSEPNRYVGALVLAVMHFQLRHGLASDGAMGEETRAALRVPIARRVRQIELALERWRWLPSRAPDRYVVVNIPAFRLYAFENDSMAKQPVLSMNVVVGEAERRRDTPVFVSVMREVVFRPYWDVPPRIARTELVPAIKRGAIDMASEGYEIVGAGDASRVYPPTRANLDRVFAGTLRLRQRPGDANALGLVKFVFPNDHDVYLHGTPAAKLFAFTRRDFSHGCIRAQQPSALASFILAGDSTWNTEAIAAAMHGDRTLHVSLAQPVTVFILYMTTVVAPDGTLYFYPDLYDGDAELERALRSLP